MFTGIIERTGRLVSIADRPFGKHLVIDPGNSGEGGLTAAHGDSIAVNGCCLTHSPEQGDDPTHLAFDVIPETLAKTNLGTLKAGSKVNLEGSLTATTLMSGHFVQGHIDATGEVCSVETEGEYRVGIRVDKSLMPYVVPKGSIAVDGVSLTIASVDLAENSFTLALIPTTLELTTFGDLKVGDPVNLETDMIVRSIVHWMDTHLAGAAGEGNAPAVTRKLLEDAGFISVGD